MTDEVLYGDGLSGDGVWTNETDWETINSDSGITGDCAANLPTIAIVGRPNVGKSTMVNRILGRREAVVADLPGVTRDRVSYSASWSGRPFMVVDTGGWEPSAKGLHQAAAEQAAKAMSVADAIILVVDATVGVTATDQAIARVLLRAKVPVLLAANKVDSYRQEAETSSLWSLGLGEPNSVSSTHGRGMGDLLDKVLKVLPRRTQIVSTTTNLRRVAIVGKPNVGKSSLLNRIAGNNRSIVDKVAGTTVDPVNELIELDGQVWEFVDTAGLRRKVRTASGHEYYASLRTRSALEAAEVAILLIDASEPLTEQDMRVLAMVVDTGRALVIALNKWDLLDEDRRYTLEREIDRELGRVHWASRINISAMTGRAVNKLVPALQESLLSWDKRIGTGQLNSWIKEVVAAHPPPVRGGRQPRIMFVTQATTRPPTFVLFTTGFLEPGYRRFLERRLREEFGFNGSPLRINVRMRDKREHRRNC